MAFSARIHVSGRFVSEVKPDQGLTLQLLQEQELHSPLQQLQEQGDILFGLWVGYGKRFPVGKVFDDLLIRLISMLRCWVEKKNLNLLNCQGMGVYIPISSTGVGQRLPIPSTRRNIDQAPDIFLAYRQGYRSIEALTICMYEVAMWLCLL